MSVIHDRLFPMSEVIPSAETAMVAVVSDAVGDDLLDSYLLCKGDSRVSLLPQTTPYLILRRNMTVSYPFPMNEQLWL